MIDPSDIELEIFRRGDGGVLPTPTGGEMGEPAVGNISVPGTKIRMFAIMSAAIAAAAELRITADDRPEYWAISLTTTVNSQVQIWPYPASAGPPITLDAGQSVSLAGLADSIFVRSTGAATATVNVIAVRGYPFGMGIVNR